MTTILKIAMIRRPYHIEWDTLYINKNIIDNNINVYFFSWLNEFNVLVDTPLGLAIE